MKSLRALKYLHISIEKGSIIFQQVNVRLKFYGGAGTVTGSKYLLEVDDRSILIDCGLFQGLKELRLRNWDKPPFSPEEISAVILTHAHLDHSGYLPKLVKEGYSGRIHCTEPTADLLEILLMDSAKLQEEEAEYARKKGYSKHENPQPLYDQKDAKLVFPQVDPHPYETPIQLFDNIQLIFHNAGHILGASSVELIIRGDHQTKHLVFSGDLGKQNDPIMYPPYRFEQADILLVESTYGDRIQPPVDNVRIELARIINETLSRDGIIVIPAFSVGRTQSILYYLKELLVNGDIPNLPVYMDSPMAIAATELYVKHAQSHRISIDEIEGEGSFLHLRKNLILVRDQEQSVALNEIDSKAIILSASGMMTGGRILHHLYHRLGDPRNTILITGFQAEGTRGRRLLEGEETIRIFGEDVHVRAKIEMIEGLSAHADQNELLDWLGSFHDSPKRTFIVHGEHESAMTFKRLIKDRLGWNTIVPGYREGFHLFEGI